METYGLHWFRRDLRVAGNPGLQWSFKKHSGRVLGIFAIDPQFLSRPDISMRRFGFFLNTLLELQKELREIGGDLLVLDQGPDESFRQMLDRLKSLPCGLPASLSFNRDYEPFALARDARLTRIFEKEYGLEVHTSADHIIIEPSEIKPYKVYTPYSKQWLELFKSDEVQSRIRAQSKNLGKKPKEKLFQITWKKLAADSFTDKLEVIRTSVLKQVDIDLPPAGHQAALDHLEAFYGPRLQRYIEDRNIPSISGTSQMSIYLKNGSITSSQIISFLGIQDTRPETGPHTYLKEIIWREFYYQVLFHWPEVERKPFQAKYANIPWENDPKLFEAWCRGETGFPIVDAGMRQLNATGWMHNRVRMIVASFLTKDLLIDYTWGENYFMKQLLDGDLAPNNGGWQWAASTGCDAQPYFRVFNPSLQEERFDPNGIYVQKWAPHSSRKPIVDHGLRAKRAIETYKKAGTGH